MPVVVIPRGYDYRPVRYDHDGWPRRDDHRPSGNHCPVRSGTTRTPNATRTDHGLRVRDAGEQQKACA